MFPLSSLLPMVVLSPWTASIPVHLNPTAEQLQSLPTICLNFRQISLFASSLSWIYSSYIILSGHSSWKWSFILSYSCLKIFNGSLSCPSPLALHREALLNLTSFNFCDDLTYPCISCRSSTVLGIKGAVLHTCWCKMI